MSGTSLDGVDYAVCEVSLDGVRLEKHWQVRYTLPLQRRLLAAVSGKAAS